EPHPIARIKRVRAAILPEMVKGEVSEAERRRRWRQLADVYLAQQLASYAPDYLRDNPTPERLLEVVERYEEDLTDYVRPHPPLTCHLTVGEAIEVSPTRDRTERTDRSGGDPLMQKIEQQLRGLLGIGPAPGAPTAKTRDTVPAGAAAP